MFLGKVNLHSEELFGLDWFNNSMLFAIGVTIAIIAFVQIGLRKIDLIPSGIQNFCEWLVEFLHDFIEGIVGKGLVKMTFSLLASLFIFILVANWSALLPGVGSIGHGIQTDYGFKVTEPYLRPANADLNMTLAMALFFMVVWMFWTWKSVGIKGFLEHTFLPKGVSGFLFYGLLPIFIFVGLIELLSIALRPVSLSLRLFGNIFGGKNLVHAMGELGSDIGGIWSHVVPILVSIPFYGLELLIGLVQALVFTMLCAVYIQLSASHEGEGH